MLKTLRVVAYGINGGGMGHVTRLCAVGRWLRRYAPLCGVRLEVWFLSSAEGESLLYREGFASFKIPSKSVVKTAKLDKEAYLALAKQWVWHSLALLRPDILLVDTFPNGSFHELFNALDLCAHRAFIYRASKAEFASRPAFQAVLPAYDLIVVPSAGGDDAAITPSSCEDRIVRIGPVMLRSRSEMLPRDEARRVLGVPEGRLAVLVTAGGGGDPEAEEALHRAIDVALSFEAVDVVVAAGPLYRGQVHRRPRVTWLSTPDLSSLWNGVDLCISAAGYNTVLETLHAGVPTVLQPQVKVADDQHGRARWAEAAGAALVAPAGDDQALRAAIESLMSLERRGQIAEAARRLVPVNHAAAAAESILSLCIPEADVDAAQEALDDRLLSLAMRAGATEEELAAFARNLGYRPPSQRPAPPPVVPRRRGRARSAETVAPVSAGEDLANGLTAVLAISSRLGVDCATVDILSRGFGRIVAAESHSVGEVGEALASVLEAFEPFHDWNSVAALLRLLAVERDASPQAIAAELRAFAAEVTARQASLPMALASLASNAAMAGPGKRNADVLRASVGALQS